MLREGFEVRLGSRSSSIWYKDWLGVGPICDLLPFVHISDTTLKVKDLWDNVSWCLNKVASFIPSNVKEAILSTNIPIHVDEDILDCWLGKGVEMVSTNPHRVTVGC